MDKKRYHVMISVIEFQNAKRGGPMSEHTEKKMTKKINHWKKVLQ